MKPLRLIATCAFGLEALVVRELKNLGYDGRVTRTGRIEFEGDLEAIARTNIHLRTADRVLLIVGQWEAADFDSLFDGTKELAWENWIGQDAEFPVNGRSLKSQLTSVPAIQRSVKKAIVERLFQGHRTEILPETGALYQIEVALLENEATLTIDTTGPSLHKRGYRNWVGGAPLKETLAAALVQLSFWRPGKPLIDPFCGSGTIPIEAALIGRNIPPGLYRSFASEDWPQMDAEIWIGVRSQARKEIRPHLEPRIVATDNDPSVLELARKHAEHAGVEEDIHFQVLDFSELSSQKSYGCLIANPPYGERMGEEEEVRELYHSMPHVLRRLPTWSHYILTAQPDFERMIGQSADRRRKLYNAKIACTYFQFHGPKPDRRSESNETQESAEVSSVPKSLESTPTPIRESSAQSTPSLEPDLKPPERDVHEFDTEAPKSPDTSQPATKLDESIISTNRVDAARINSAPDHSAPGDPAPINPAPINPALIDSEPVDSSVDPTRDVAKDFAVPEMPIAERPEPTELSEHSEPIEPHVQKSPPKRQAAFGGLSPRDHETASAFKNRLIKRARHLRRWPKQKGITCYRLYERDIPEVPLVVDRYEHYLHISEFDRPHERTLAQHADWLDLMVKNAAEALDVRPKDVFVKFRYRQKGLTQYQKQNNVDSSVVVKEGGLKFLVNLSDYVDTGLFLDHRITRSMIQAEAKDKRFLNLYCYTGSFTTYAAAGGAESTTSVDLSSTYLDWAERNLTLNNLKAKHHEFIRQDVFTFLHEAVDRRLEYDLAFVDPPTHSNSKMTQNDWDVQEDHFDMLNALIPLMTRGGVIYFSTNFRRFKLREEVFDGLEWSEITAKTLPEDFRNRRIHRCWKIICP